MNATQESTTVASRAEQRAHRRVDVKLNVVVVLDRGTSTEARTENISEGGILLDTYAGPPLQQGRLVGLNMRGVLCDSDDEGAQRFLMRVVRQDGAVIALRFSPDS